MLMIFFALLVMYAGACVVDRIAERDRRERIARRVDSIFAERGASR